MPTNSTSNQAITAAGGFLPSDALGASSSTEFQFSKSSSRYILILPGSDKLKNRPIKIRCWGRATGGTTENFTAQVYYGTSATIGSNTSLATTGAIAVNSVSGNWMLELEGIWDGTSSKFQGTYHGWVNGTAKTETIFASVIKPGSATSTEGLGFTCTGTWSGTDAGQSATLDGFEIEVI